jgi:hypothetical protein
MSGKAWLAAMVAGTALVVLVGARHDTAPPPEAAPRALPETPWLTREATDQVIAADGNLGPLFTGVVLGGTPPLAGVRARIAEFARANDVEIAFEIVDEEVRAVRFDVSFSGCCGYEAADTLGRRLGRPKIGGGCVGGEVMLLNEWAFTLDEGVYVSARVHVNRVQLRWEPMATLEEVLKRADRLLGTERAAVAKAAGDRWLELSSGGYRLEVPYPFRASYAINEVLGIDVVVEKGRVAEVSFSIRDPREQHPGVPSVLRSHWGRPRLESEEPTWTWRKPDRIIRANFDADGESTTIVLRRR